MSKITKSSLLRTLLTIGLVISILPTAAAEAAGAIYRVKENGSTSGSCGESWGNSCSLQYALNLAQAGDQVWVARGTYKPTASADRTVSFNLKSGVAVYGGFAGTETLLSQRDPVANFSVLSGDIGTPGVPTDNSYHVVYVLKTDQTGLLDGFTVTDGYANGEIALNNGAGLYSYLSSAVIRNVIFQNNTTAGKGGGVYSYESSGIYTNITFKNNSAGVVGGGMFNSISNSTLTDVTFTGNTAGLHGGGMYIITSAPIITNATFTGNSAVEHGGAILHTDAANSVITNSSFINNKAGRFGGAIANFSSNPSFTNVTLNGNNGPAGGAMYNQFSAPTLSDVVFQNNTAEKYGGGIYNEDSDPILINVTFSGNYSDKGGGLFYYLGSSQLTNVTFSGNTAVYSAGGLYSYECDLILTNVLFNDNSTQTRGGGMILNYGTASMTDITFTNNSAPSYGGGLDVSGADPVIDRIIFSGNSSNRGGGMYIYHSDPMISNALFTGNSAGEHGGGFYTYSSSPVVTGTTFYKNQAGAYGGGMYNVIGHPVLTNVTFTGNAADEFGGGMFKSGGALTLNNSTFAYNTAGSLGGGLTIGDSDAIVKNSLFWANSAGSAGSQINSFDSGVPVIRNSLIENGCPAKGTCSDILTGDPTLGTLGDHGGFTPTIPLLPGSAAIDSGNSATCAPTDQRGISRPQGIRCDIGAYEADEIGLIKTSPANQAVLVEDTLTLRWTPSNGLGSYEVCADTTDNGSCDTGWLAAGSTTNHSLTASTLTPGSTYYWQVRALGGADWYYADNGIWWSFTLNEISPRIDQKLTTSKVSFDWSDIPGAVAYKIQLSSKPDFSTVLFNIKSPTSTYTYATALKYNTAYYWRVRPIFSNSKGSWSSAYRFYSMNALSSPVLTSPGHKDNIASQFTLFWQGVENGAAYKVVIATDASFSNKVGFEKTAELSANFTLPAGKYFWRVRAFDASGIKSAWSETRKFFVEATP